MDDLTLLRKVRESVTNPSKEVLLTGRMRLIRSLQVTTLHVVRDSSADKRSVTRRGRMRRLGWISGTGLVAAGVVTALVVGNIVGLAGWRGGADSAAADTLDQAARAALRTSDPLVGPGQYLEVKTKAAYASFSLAPDGTPTGFLESQDGQLYVPAERNQVWTWVRDRGVVVQTFGPESSAAAAAEGGRPGEFLTAKSGSFYGSPADPSPATISSLPTDPTRLLNYIYRTTFGQGVSPDGEALIWIADMLRSGIAPQGVRATLYRAAAMIPGVTLTAGSSDLDGRRGVAIGRDESNGIRQEIIIDPTTGLMMGEREVLLKASGGIPAGASMGWTSITTTVVDRAPAAPSGSTAGSGK